MLQREPWHRELTFVAPMGFYSRRLAYGLDSLVRVSRRVIDCRFGRIAFRPLRPQRNSLGQLSRSWKSAEAFLALGPHSAFWTRKNCSEPFPGPASPVR